MGQEKGIELSGELADRINGALEGGKAIAVSYVDGKGRPHLSLRGSTQVHSSDQLSIWVRHASGGIADGIDTNPSVALLYRDPVSRTTLVFSGRARVATDAATRDIVFERMPQAEKDHDPERNGLAVIIDLDIVEGATVGGPTVERVSMQRS